MKSEITYPSTLWDGGLFFLPTCNTLFLVVDLVVKVPGVMKHGILEHGSLWQGT